MNEYTVGEVARLAHVSVRTLHHYDEIGLLAPRGRSAAGYRLYSDMDLAHLQQILFYRELDFGLDEIASILSGTENADDHLRRQHRMLRERLARNEALLGAIEKEMEARQMGISLTPEEQFEIFGTDKVSGEWAQEAEQRWGHTEAWAQSQRKTATYTKQDWIEIQAEATSLNQAFLDAKNAAIPADDPRAMDVAETHRQHICRWFYDCGYDIHRGLAQMYLADERFGKNFDDMAPGLAQYVHDAMIANADRAPGRDD